MIYVLYLSIISSEKQNPIYKVVEFLTTEKTILLKNLKKVDTDMHGKSDFAI